MLNETDLATGLMLFGPLVAISLTWLIGAILTKGELP